MQERDLAKSREGVLSWVRTGEARFRGPPLHYGASGLCCHRACSIVSLYAALGSPIILNTWAAW